MVNLIRRAGDREAFSGLDPVTHARYLERIDGLRRLCGGGITDEDELLRRLRPADAEPDLETTPSFATLELCLDELDHARRRHAAGLPSPPGEARARGRLLVFEPGLALSSGEAEAASRGFFDVEDRPPWATWLVAVHRPSPAAGEARSAPSRIGVLAWVPPALLSRADAGIRACPTRALHWLDALAGPLAEQLAPRPD